jgi:hypothetical protein
VLLHASLALRLAGDAVAGVEPTRWGALLSALALIAFVGNIVVTVAAARRKR